MAKVKLKCNGEWVLIGSIAQVDESPAPNHAGVDPSGKLTKGDLIKIVGKGYQRTQGINSLIPKNGLDWIGIEEWPVNEGDEIYVCVETPRGPGPKPKPKPPGPEPKPKPPGPELSKPFKVNDGDTMTANKPGGNGGCP